MRTVINESIMKHCKIFLVLSLALVLTGLASSAEAVAFTRDFFIEQCTFSSTGRNTYFILEPGHKLVLEGFEGAEEVKLVITVLDATETVDGVETRVVREVETKDGELVEISRNFFAICNETGNVFYFGEEVDIYEDGVVVSHEGAWRVGQNGAKPGVIMPGSPMLGAKYFQEIAPGVAMDRAEVLQLNAVVGTPFGIFQRCLKTKETTPIEPDAKESKFYAPGIGLVSEKTLFLTNVVTP